MHNPLHPDLKYPSERIEEIGRILAAGLIRMRARKSSRLSGEREESSLDFSPDQSGDANRKTTLRDHNAS